MPNLIKRVIIAFTCFGNVKLIQHISKDKHSFIRIIGYKNTWPCRAVLHEISLFGSNRIDKEGDAYELMA